MSEAGIEKFFAIARERYSILLKRRAGEPKPWTDDPIFRVNRFCNVHREDDKTTEWFRENIRNKVRDEPTEALAAITAFRWFNRIETGEKIKEFLLGEWDSVKVFNKLANVKPVVTGAYIIKTPDGMQKLKGVLWCIDQFNKMLIDGKFDNILEGNSTHEHAQSLLEEAPYLGKFMAYQIIADARYTCLLGAAKDIFTWAQPGPGSTRGVGRLFYNDLDKFNYGSKKDGEAVVEHMCILEEESHNPKYWPHDWESFEMQDIQNWFCEYDKYCRAEEGGHMKRIFL